MLGSSEGRFLDFPFPAPDIPAKGLFSSIGCVESIAVTTTSCIKLATLRRHTSKEKSLVGDRAARARKRSRKKTAQNKNKKFRARKISKSPRKTNKSAR
jgi:hypothetical protein